MSDETPESYHIVLNRLSEHLENIDVATSAYPNEMMSEFPQSHNFFE